MLKVIVYLSIVIPAYALEGELQEPVKPRFNANAAIRDGMSARDVEDVKNVMRDMHKPPASHPYMGYGRESLWPQFPSSELRQEVAFSASGMPVHDTALRVTGRGGKGGRRVTFQLPS